MQEKHLATLMNTRLDCRFRDEFGLSYKHTRMMCLLTTGSHISNRVLVIACLAVLANLWFLPQPSSAEEGWSLEGRGVLFYTDDVGLFSATRRLSRDGDPTQPAIDSKLTDQGSDVVFEPLMSVTRSLTNSLGRLDLNVQGQGFVFTENPQFNHGTLRLQATQDLSSSNPRTGSLLPTLLISFSATMRNASPARTS